jgi:hypothetical protein
MPYNSPMLPELKKNSDGSLTLYGQKWQPRRGQGKQLAARAEGRGLSGHALVLAEHRLSLHPTTWIRLLVSASTCESGIISYPLRANQIQN